MKTRNEDKTFISNISGPGQLFKKNVKILLFHSFLLKNKEENNKVIEEIEFLKSFSKANKKYKNWIFSSYLCLQFEFIKC